MAVLRHQLFLPSETFISEQARALGSFSPLLVGRVLCGRPHTRVPWYVPPAGRLEQLRYVLGQAPGLFLPELKSRGARLIHAHFGVEAVYAMELAERLAIPLVTTFHGFDATMRSRDLIASRRPTWLRYLLQRGQLKRRGALFIAVSEFVRSRLLALGFPEERIRLHYIGVDTSTFVPAARQRASRPLVLHVARLVEKKGTAYLLDAFARIAARHPDAEIAIIGDGPLGAALEAHAAALGIGSQVRFLGARPHADVRAWLGRASVLCLPSCTAGNGDAEGLGLVLLEAAASGVPVVGTRHGGIPEAVVDGETGLLVPERDAEALADALDSLLGAESLRQRLGAAAAQFARDRFDLIEQTRALERIYNEAL